MTRHSPLATHRSPPRVAFVTSHPIQYQVPVFRELAKRTDMNFVVLFAMLPDAAAQGAGFGVEFEWDIPLLEGYEYSVLNNVAAQPGVTHYKGCDTPEIAAELKQRNIDAVVVNGWVVKTCLQTLTACRKLGIPCIVRGEANNLRPRPLWKRLIQRQLVRRYDAYLPIGTASRNFYRGYGVKESVMFNAPYCVENDRFARAAQEAAPRRNELRSRWQIPENAVCFLFCGKFETKKHPVEFVQAFMSACSQLPYAEPSNHPPIHLLMVGDGELRHQCEQLATRLSPLATITFTVFLNQSEIVDAYVAADVLTLPSDHGETWGLVVNEAMACGLPAIVSDQVGCASDLIIQDQTGWVFKSGDWTALSKLIGKIARTPACIHGMDNKCRRQIEDYSPLVAANGIAEAVQNCLHDCVGPIA